MATQNKLRNDTTITGYLEVQSFIKLLAGTGYLDMAQNELRNAVIQVLAAEPSTPAAGQIIYNSSRAAGSRIGYYNGSAWIYFNADADTLDGQHGTYYLSRTNQTGTQTASTISDFTEAAQDAVGTILTDTYSVDFTYDDTANTIKADIKLVSGGGLEAVAGGVQLTATGVTAGTYTKLTVDAKGRVTGATNVTAGDLPAHDSMHYGIPLSSLALPTADVAMNGRKITGLADPINPQDGVNLRTLQSAVEGMDGKDSVKLATTANISLSGVGVSIDGVTTAAGQRILVKDQTNKTENGIYIIASGTWTRATDTDTWAELVSAYVWVEQGTVNGDTGWLCTVDSGGTLGSTNVTWVQWNGAGQIVAGSGLSKTGNQIDVNVDGTTVIIDGDTIKLGAGYANKKATGTFTGTGAAKSFTLTHNLNTLDILPPTIRQAADNQLVIVPVVAATVNTVTVEFNPAPANGEIFNWVVM